MARVEVVFRDRIGPYTRGQVAELDSETVFFKALIKGGKAEVVNPPDWSPDGESNSEPSEPAEPAKPRNRRRSRKKSEESPAEVAEHSAEGHGESGELVQDRESDDLGENAGEDSVGRPEYQGDSEWYSGSVSGYPSLGSRF